MTCFAVPVCPEQKVWERPPRSSWVSLSQHSWLSPSPRGFSPSMVPPPSSAVKVTPGRCSGNTQNATLMVPNHFRFMPSPPQRANTQEPVRRRTGFLSVLRRETAPTDLKITGRLKLNYIYSRMRRSSSSRSSFPPASVPARRLSARSRFWPCSSRIFSSMEPVVTMR